MKFKPLLSIIALLCGALLFLSLSLSALDQVSADEPINPVDPSVENDVVEPDLDQPARPLRPYQPLAGDDDGDGLMEADEITLKTDPNNVDSDCDYIDDGTEVGNVATPTDADNDGRIDALESNVADSNQNTTPDHQDNAAGLQLTCGRFIPFAIANTGTDVTRIELRVIGSNVTAVGVQMSAANSPFLKVDGAEVTAGNFISLYDDGTHGDQRAGDGLWSRTGFSSDSPNNNFFSWARDFTFDTFQVTDSNGTVTVDMTNAFQGLGGIKVGLVKSESVQTPITASAQVQAVSNLVNIINPPGALDVKDGFNDGARLREAGQLFYTAAGLGDSFDFVLFMADGLIPAPYAAFYSPVRNDVQNIGDNLFDLTAQYGSSGQLQGVMVINFNDNGPTMHEIMHRWATPNLSSLNFHQCQDFGHWGVAGVGEGQLGGFDPASLVDNNNGTFTVNSFGLNANGGDSVDYVPLELYLAGFVEASAVPTIPIPLGVNCDFNTWTSDQNTYTFPATGPVQVVTIDQIKTALGGERIPSAATSQKNFKAALVVVSQYRLNGAELAFYNGWSQNFGAPTGNGFLKSFREATGGVASMDTTISIIPKVDTRVTAPGLVAAEASSAVTLPITYGNDGSATATPVTLTAVLSTGLSYLGDTSGVTPTISSAADRTTLTWLLPDLVTGTTRSFNLQMNVAAVPDGTNLSCSLSIAGGGAAEDNLANNTFEAVIAVGGTQIYLPVLMKE